MGTVLAFDYGLRRIGVAVGNPLTATASTLPALPARDGVPDWERIRGLISEWRPELLLVGLPLNMDGTPSEMSERATRFARRLHGRFGLRCELMDERLSSFEARERLAAAAARAGAKRAAAPALDSVAACVILESWFAGRASANG
jgi:putative holliday junction resolvase